MGSVLDLSGSSDSLDWILNRSDEEISAPIGKWLGKSLRDHKQRLCIKTNLHMVKKGKGSLSKIKPKESELVVRDDFIVVLSLPLVN